MVNVSVGVAMRLCMVACNVLSCQALTASVCTILLMCCALDGD